MRLRAERATAGILCLLSWACGDSGPSAPQASPSPSPVAVMPTPLPGAPRVANGVFDVAILVEREAPQTPRPDVERVFRRAGSIMFEKTGEALWETGVTYGMARGPHTDDMVRRYAATVATDAPDGVLVLSADDGAHIYGGYSFSFRPAFAFSNEFPSPRAGEGAGKIYVAVTEFHHPYARCGYDEQGRRVSDVSIGGECRNQPGTPCVQRGSRWMCSTALEDLYAEDDYFTACTIVHEFLHPFGISADGAYDHYGSQECAARTGATASDLRQFQLHCGVCPDVYQRFRRAR